MMRGSAFEVVTVLDESREQRRRAPVITRGELFFYETRMEKDRRSGDQA